MGDCLYLRAPDIHCAAPQLLVLSSESWRHPEAVGGALAAEHWINTTTGMWVYETALLEDRAAVVAKLRALADMVESSEIDRLHREARRNPRGARLRIWVSPGG